MFTRLALAALLVAISTSLAAAQSSTPVPAMKTAPTAGSSGQSKSRAGTSSGSAIINPAAREGEKGLSGNPDEQVRIRRLK